ncbi:MAG: TetR/AcrR family transcriptional regulator [Steroidobacteraceae bacterium]
MDSSTSARSQRRRGPRGQDAAIKTALLEAGASLYATKGLAPISLREIADGARVNPAMVRYYFKDRHGFLGALLDYGYEAVLREARTHAEVAPSDLENLLSGIFRAVSDRPWLPILLMQTVLGGSELRDAFINQHVPRMRATLRDALQRAAGAGDLRRDLDPDLALLTLVSMMFFPQVARPVVSRAFGVTVDRQFGERLAGFATQLLCSNSAGGRRC